MLFQIIILIVGLVLLILGANWLIDGSSVLAKKNGISDLAIGLTIVAFGTSAPELVINIIASFQGHEDIVFGNVIGSNNFNTLIILGIAGIITPMIVQSTTVWKEIPLSFFAIVILFLLANNIFNSEVEMLSRIDGFILLIMFALFLYYVYKQLRVDKKNAAFTSKNYSPLKICLLIITGLFGLIFGGRLAVVHAVKIATNLGISEKIIGLTIIAAGTSLPELVTSIVAAIRKNNDIAVGNIIGSNIFNIFLILGASALVKPLEYSNTFNRDLLLLAGATLFLFTAMFTGKKKKLDRWEAAVLLLGYMVYMYLLIQQVVGS